MASPLNLDILDVNRFIEQKQVKEVTSVFIRHSSSTEFDNKGLFSEDIFGQVGTPERLVTFGYINLNCKILHPIIYNNILKLARWYGEIMNGKTHAVFNEKARTFEKATPEAGKTGFMFFMDNVKKLDFGSSKSLTQQDKIDVIKKSQHKMTLDKMLVMPAGWRDVNVEDTRVDKDSVNKLYVSLINYAKALEGIKPDPIYNNIMFAIQKKVLEIFQYWFNVAEGKKGFFQSKYGSRNLALGTRNVISLGSMAASSPDSADYLKVDEIGVPVFQAAKMYMPLIVYSMKTYFFNEIFSMTADNIVLIDKKTKKLEYVPVSEETKNSFLSSDGIEKIVNLFKDKETRNLPITVMDENDKEYYMYLVYDTGDTVYKVRSVDELKATLRDMKLPYHEKNLRPMTYVELIYIATFLATEDKYSYVTRYPAIEIGSTVPCKTHVLTTSPSRMVKLHLKQQEEETVSGFVKHSTDQKMIVTNASTGAKALLLPKYPVINARYNDSTTIHPSIMKGLNADFDGDTVTVSGMLSTEATEEARKYLGDKARYIDTNGNLFACKTDIMDLTLFNLSRDPKP